MAFLFPFLLLFWVEAFWGRSERMVARVCRSCIELFSPCSLMSRLPMRFTPAIFFYCSSVPYSGRVPPLPCHVPNFIALFNSSNSLRKLNVASVTDYLQLSLKAKMWPYNKLFNWGLSAIIVHSFNFLCFNFPFFFSCDVARPNLCLTALSATFCHVGRILVVDQSRPVPPVHQRPIDEDGNSHSFHPREKTEVSHLGSFLFVFRTGNILQRLWGGGTKRWASWWHCFYMSAQLTGGWEVALLSAIDQTL